MGVAEKLFKNPTKWQYIVDDDLSFIDTFILNKIESSIRKQLKMNLIEKLKQVAVFHITGSTTYIYEPRYILRYGDKLIDRLNGVEKLAIIFEDLCKLDTFNINSIKSILVWAIDDAIDKDPDFITIKNLMNQSLDTFNIDDPLNNEPIFGSFDMYTIQSKVNAYLNSNKTIDIEFNKIININKLENFINNHKFSKKLLKDYKNMLRDSLIVMLFYKSFYNYLTFNSFDNLSKNLIIRSGTISFKHFEWVNPYFDEDLLHKYGRLDIPVIPTLRIKLRPFEDIDPKLIKYNLLYEEK